MTTVGLGDHRHDVGACYTTFILPGMTAAAPCGDPRCEAAHYRHPYRVLVAAGEQRMEHECRSPDHEESLRAALVQFAGDHKDLQGVLAAVAVKDAATGHMLVTRFAHVPTDTALSRRDSDERFAEQLGIDPDDLQAAIQGVWSQLNPQKTRYEVARAVAAAALASVAKDRRWRAERDELGPGQRSFGPDIRWFIENTEEGRRALAELDNWSLENLRGVLFRRVKSRPVLTKRGERKLRELGLWWTGEDQVAAQAQGWGVFEHDGMFEINRLEQPGDFAYSKVRDDAALVDALVARAHEDEIAARALNYVAFRNTGSPYFSERR